MAIRIMTAPRIRSTDAMRVVATGGADEAGKAAYAVM
jgi:hypothetical protein